jgi:hypothetical protein
MTCLVAVALCTMALAGCGGQTRGPIVVQADASHIAKTTVDHWIGVIGGDTTAPTTSEHRLLKQTALGFLISSAWLLGADPGGLQFEAASANEGGTGDARLEAVVHRAYSSLLGRLGVQATGIAKSRIASYYHAHTVLYMHPESRDAEVVRTRTEAAAQRAKALILAGVPFARVARAISVDVAGKTDGGLVPEILRSQEDPVLKRAVFSAGIRVLTGPVMLETARYYLFEIVRIHPASDVTLADAEQRRLPALRERILRQLLQSWLRRRLAHTTCSAGYIAPGCRQSGQAHLILNPRSAAPVATSATAIPNGNEAARR